MVNIFKKKKLINLANIRGNIPSFVCVSVNSIDSNNGNLSSDIVTRKLTSTADLGFCLF